MWEKNSPPAWLYTRTNVYNVLHSLNLVGAHSQMNRAEKECLKKYASGKFKALEIGTYMGVTASVIAGAMPDKAELYCIDPFKSELYYKMAVRELKRQQVFNKIRFLKGYSNDAAIIEQVPSQLDFILVDGDHSYKGLENDWAIVQSRLATNGIVCLHDTTIPESEPYRNFGSVEYFNKMIKDNKDYVHLETVYSMNVLLRK